MSFTLHYGGVGRAFVVADSLPGDNDEPIPYTADALMQDIKACAESGGDWLLVHLRRGDMVTLWFGAGVPMYITEQTDDEDLIDALADIHDPGADDGGAQVLDLAPTRQPISPRAYNVFDDGPPPNLDL